MKAHQGERVAARIDALLGSLEEAGHYPLTQETIDQQIEQLQTLIGTAGEKNPRDKVLSEVAMALHRASSELQKAEKMIKTGKLPKSGHRGAFGGSIRAGGGN